MAQVDQQFASITRLLCIPSELRSELQLQQLVDCTQHIKFFSSVPKSVHAACCRVMKSADYNTGDVIFRYGDKPDGFCIILRGRVSVGIVTWTNLGIGFLKLPGADMTHHPGSRKNSGLQPSVEARRSSHARASSEFTVSPVLSEVTTLGVGTSFGELGLLRGEKRSATITCIEPTTIAVLEKGDFDLILREYEAKLLNDKIEFLISVPAFATWSSATMSKCSYYFNERTYAKGEVVYREGEPAIEVFVIIEGEFKLPSSPGTKLASSRLRAIQGSPNKPSAPQIQLILKSAKELFGDLEVMEDSNRDSTCICASKSARLFAVSKAVRSTQDFLKRLHNVNTFNYLKEKMTNEQKWMRSRISGLMAVEKYKSEFAEKMSSPHIDKLIGNFQPPQVASNDYQSMRKDLMTFSNISHKHTISDVLLPPHHEIDTHFATARGATQRGLTTSRAPSVMTTKDQISTFLGTSRRKLQPLKRRS